MDNTVNSEHTGSTEINNSILFHLFINGKKISRESRFNVSLIYYISTLCVLFKVI